MMQLQELHKLLHARASNLDLEIDCISSGDVNSEIALISDYPGTTEAKTKVPLSGGTGAELWKTLRKYKIALADRGKIYVSNAVKRIVTNDLDGEVHIHGMEFLLYKELLEFELSNLPNLKYIIVMGAQAMEMLCAQTNMLNWHGSVFHLQINNREVLALPTFNPAYAFRKSKLTQEFEDPIREQIMLNDCRKFVRMVEGKYEKHEVECTVIRTLDDFDALLMHLSEAAFISYDIEHWNKQTACIGFATNGYHAYVLPFCDTEKSLWSANDEGIIREGLQTFFDTAKPKLIGQNCMTDATWLWFKDRICVGPHYFDTMLAHHHLYSTMPHSLAQLTAQYTWHPYYKDEGTEWYSNGDIEEFWQYNAKDCALTYYIATQKLIPELRQRGLYDSFMHHKMRFDWECVKATALGIQTDAAQIQRFDTFYSKKLQTEKTELEASISAAIDLEKFQTAHRAKVREAAEVRARKTGTTGDELADLIDKKIATAEKRFDKNSELNLASPAHLNTLFSVMRLPDAGKTTDKFQFARWFSHPLVSDEYKNILKAIQQQRSDEKFYSTNVKVRVDADERCRYQYNQTGTRTAPGRISSTQNIWRTGTNMQNQPEKARAQFIADCDEIILLEQEGHTLYQVSDIYGEYDPYVFIYIDGEQAEARYVAYCATSPEYPDGIVKWKEEFEYARTHPGELDCHRALAARMFNKPYDEIPKYDWISEGVPSERYLGKRARHGLNYRMGPETFSERTGISQIQANSVYGSYHRETPELRSWWKKEENLAKHNILTRGYHIMRNSFGGEMVYHCRWTKAQSESIIAFKPQSSIGEWMKATWYRCHDDDRWPKDKARLLLNVHDAIIGIARASVAKTCLAIMVKHAETPMIVEDQELIIPASCMISYANEAGKHAWSNMRKVQL